MVMNSFWKRNFMQPMRRPEHALKVPCFFSFKVLGCGGWGRGARNVFHFSLLPNVFPLGYTQILNGFPICSPSSGGVPQHVPHSTSLLSHMFCQMLSSFHLYRCAKGYELYTSTQNLQFWRASIVSVFY